MSTTVEIAIPAPRSTRVRPLGPLATLAGRRFQLTARTPRELVVPLLTPIMFALVIAPALKTALHTGTGYESFVAIGTVGLLIPLNTMFSGLSVIVDRVSGAQRELLAAPIPRGMLVVGNLLVALAITALQVGVLIAFTVGMYGAAGDPRQSRPATGGVHRARPRNRDLALVSGRRALSDYGAAELPDLGGEVPAAHARTRAHALRARQRQHRPARDLEHERPHSNGGTQHRSRPCFRIAPHGGLHPRLLSLRGAVSCSHHVLARSSRARTRHRD